MAALPAHARSDCRREGCCACPGTSSTLACVHPTSAPALLPADPRDLHGQFHGATAEPKPPRPRWQDAEAYATWLLLGLRHGRAPVSHPGDCSDHGGPPGEGQCCSGPSGLTTSLGLQPPSNKPSDTSVIVPTLEVGNGGQKQCVRPRTMASRGGAEPGAKVVSTQRASRWHCLRSLLSPSSHPSPSPDGDSRKGLVVTAWGKASMASSSTVWSSVH